MEKARNAVRSVAQAVGANDALLCPHDGLLGIVLDATMASGANLAEYKVFTPIIWMDNQYKNAINEGLNYIDPPQQYTFASMKLDITPIHPMTKPIAKGTSIIMTVWGLYNLAKLGYKKFNKR